MKQCTKVNGSEYILDLGTGAGYNAVNFSKLLKSGKVFGVDKFDKDSNVINFNFFEELKINFFGNTLNQAKKNMIIEKQKDKIFLIKSDLKNNFPFLNNSFDIVMSSQFLYCIPTRNLNDILNEIDRILKPSGKIVFFESKSFLNWNIGHIKVFFDNMNYSTSIFSFEKMPNKCVFCGQKPHSDDK